MNDTPIASLTAHFSNLIDPDIERTKRHDLIVIATCTVICGADSWVEVELFGKSRKE